MNKDCLLIAVLKNPKLMKQLNEKQWDTLICQGRYSFLLARLYFLAREIGLDSLPQRPIAHLFSVWVRHQKQTQALEYEVLWLARAHSEVDARLVFLKGAAYHFAKLPFANGRLISDIDLLITKKLLTELERSMNRYGFKSGGHDEYDMRYYRKWMHEIPPLQHFKRDTVLDIHHTILPPTARFNPDPEKLFDAMRQVQTGVYVLAPVDMFIHSATHLFHEGELEHGLRDLADLDGMLTFFGPNERNFWKELVPRAIELDLIRPLYYGLRYTRLILETSVPERVIAEAEAGQPNRLMGKLMDFLFLRALMPDHPSCDRPFTDLSRWLLYIRSHYLRMPLYLLLPHLVRKAWKRQFDKPEALVPVEQGK